jgi:hypothetical protein
MSFLGRDRDVTTNGTPLLAHNPMRGIRLPVEKNPRRPIETYDRYLKSVPSIKRTVATTGCR